MMRSRQFFGRIWLQKEGKKFRTSSLQSLSRVSVQVRNLRHFSKFLKVLLVKASYTYFRSKYIYFHRRKKGFQLKKLLRMREKNDTHLTSSKASAEWKKQRRQQTNVHNSILDCYSLESSRVCCSEFLLAERHLEWQEWLLVYIRSIAIRWKFARLLFRIFVG